MLDTMSAVANFGVRWCTIICSGSAIVTGGARHRTAVLRQLQVVSVLTTAMLRQLQMVSILIYITYFRFKILIPADNMFFYKVCKDSKLAALLKIAVCYYLKESPDII